MTAQCQSSVLLLIIFDQLMEQAFNIQEVMRDAHLGAIRPPGNRDSFNILDSPTPELVGKLDFAHSGLLFPGSEL